MAWARFRTLPAAVRGVRAPARPAALPRPDARTPGPRRRSARRASGAEAASAADSATVPARARELMEIRRFGVGNRRPEGPTGTVGRRGPGHPLRRARRRSPSSRSARAARIEPHDNPNTTWFIVIEGGGYVLVGEERAAGRGRRGGALARRHHARRLDRVRPDARDRRGVRRAPTTPTCEASSRASPSGSGPARPAPSRRASARSRRVPRPTRPIREGEPDLAPDRWRSRLRARRIGRSAEGERDQPSARVLVARRAIREPAGASDLRGHRGGRTCAPSCAAACGGGPAAARCVLAAVAAARTASAAGRSASSIVRSPGATWPRWAIVVGGRLEVGRGTRPAPRPSGHTPPSPRP